MTAHPRYINPTIAAAICEIVFQPMRDVPWDGRWFSSFFHYVQEEFPTFEPQPEISVNPSTGQIIGYLQHIRYRHKEQPVQLSLVNNNRMAVVLLPTYPGWEVMRQWVEYAWQKLNEVIKIQSIPQIGLRYINRIQRRSEEETLEEWLKNTEYIPTAVLKSQPGFLSIVKTHIEAGEYLNVVIGEEAVPGGVEIKGQAFLFDIERYSVRQEVRTGEEPANISMELGIDLVLGKLEALHEDIWRVFEAAKSPRLESLLNGELS